MLSAVFFGQPLGQLLACVVSLATTSALREGISGASKTKCTGNCLHTADIIWRWIVGCGAVPPIFALILRLYIPESPRWLLEVEKNPMGIAAAAYTVDKFYADPLLDDEIEVGMMNNVPESPPSSSGEHRTVAQSVYDQQSEQPGTSQKLTMPAIPSGAPSSTVVDPNELERMDSHPSPRRRPMAPQDLIFKEPRVTMNDPDAITPVHHGAQHVGGYGEDLPTPALQLDHPTHTPNGRQLPSQPEMESWQDFWKSFGKYLFGKEAWTWRRLGLCLQLRDTHFFDGSWTDLAGLAFTWFLLDFGFYFLIVNSFKLMTRIWVTEDPDDVYKVIFQYAWRIITSTSIGAVAGGAIFIAMARNRWKLQLYGFLVLVVLFVISGVVFIKLIGGRYFATFIVLYCLCHLSFNLGPNTSTFVVSQQPS
jgi:PHS family inorganic phosphate transporter-like MFS transporter